jgi:hypothetical protein
MFASMSNARPPDSDQQGFGYFSLQSWQHIDGRRAQLSICVCDGNPELFERKILFRKSTGGFAVVDRLSLHPDSLKRIEDGLPKLQQDFGKRPTKPLAWSSVQGSTKQLRLVAADNFEAVFVDSTNAFMIVDRRQLDDRSDKLLVRIIRSKGHSGSSHRLVAQVDDDKYQQKLMAKLTSPAEQEELRNIAVELAGVPSEDVNEWLEKVNSGLQAAGTGIVWKVPVMDPTRKPDVKREFERLLYEDMFAMLNLPTAAYNALKEASEVSVIVEAGIQEQRSGEGTTVLSPSNRGETHPNAAASHAHPEVGGFKVALQNDASPYTAGVVAGEFGVYDTYCSGYKWPCQSVASCWPLTATCPSFTTAWDSTMACCEPSWQDRCETTARGKPRLFRLVRSCR